MNVSERISTDAFSPYHGTEEMVNAATKKNDRNMNALRNSFSSFLRRNPSRVNDMLLDKDFMIV